MTRALTDLPRWLLLAGLIIAPWAYGCTRPWAITGLNALLSVLLLAWGASCAGRRSWPVVPPLLAGASIWLIGQAWLHTAGGSPTAAAWRATVLLGTLCFASDLARRAPWRKRLWWVMGLTGSSIIAFGLVQRMAGAPAIFWSGTGEDETFHAAGIFFATFDYHANAGAFLNLVWPLIGGLMIHAFGKSTAHGQRAFWTVGLALGLVAVFVNTSRGSQFVGGVLLAILLGWLGVQVVRRRLPGFNPRFGVLALVLLLGLVAVAAASVGLESSTHRWSFFIRDATVLNLRRDVWAVCLRLVPEAGWLGFGPGTFGDVFRNRVATGAAHFAGIEFAHQDYLQTMLEWGYLGTLAGALIFLGGIVRATRAMTQDRSRRLTRDQLLRGAGLAAVFGVALHSLVDYPMQIASLQLYTAVLLGILWSCRAWTDPRNSGETEFISGERR